MFHGVGLRVEVRNGGLGRGGRVAHALELLASMVLREETFVAQDGLNLLKNVQGWRDGLANSNLNRRCANGIHLDSVYGRVALHAQWDWNFGRRCRRDRDYSVRLRWLSHGGRWAILKCRVSEMRGSGGLSRRSQDVWQQSR